ncbi:GtrA family protein [Kitasatospora sp. NPDC049258]|uniref:GtrA family protein n=1 Tax=Kitasatospora sp. NPDC049258 TaxID=3155394 RepID=UPI003429956A
MWQLIRFGLVGVVNTGTCLALFWLLHPALPYLAAFSLAYLISMVGSFFLNTRFTYRTRPTWRKFLLFPLPNLTNYLLQTAGLFALVHWCHLAERIAPAVVAVGAIPISFLLTRLVLTGRASGSPQGDELRAAPVRVEVVDQ